VSPPAGLSEPGSPDRKRSISARVIASLFAESTSASQPSAMRSAIAPDPTWRLTIESPCRRRSRARRMRSAAGEMRGAGTEGGDNLVPSSGVRCMLLNMWAPPELHFTTYSKTSLKRRRATVPARPQQRRTILPSSARRSRGNLGNLFRRTHERVKRDAAGTPHPHPTGAGKTAAGTNARFRQGRSCTTAPKRILRAGTHARGCRSLPR